MFLKEVQLLNYMRHKNNNMSNADDIEFVRIDIPKCDRTDELWFVAEEDIYHLLAQYDYGRVVAQWGRHRTQKLGSYNCTL